MTKSETKRLEAKKREWNESLRGFDKFVSAVKKEIKFDSKQMLNFIMFYKPKNKFDKVWHACEMVIIYVIIQFAWRGMTGW